MPNQWWECINEGCQDEEGNNPRKWSIMRKPACKFCGRKVGMKVMDPQPEPPENWTRTHLPKVTGRSLNEWYSLYRDR